MVKRAVITEAVTFDKTFTPEKTQRGSQFRANKDSTLPVLNRAPPAPGGRRSLPLNQEVAVPGNKKPGKSIKKPKVYEALRDQGMPKEKAAKISNAQKAKKKKS